MRTWMSVLGVGVLVAVLPGDAAARQEPVWRARVVFEAQSGRAGERVTGTAPGERWHASHLVVASGDGSWERGRVRLAGGLLTNHSSDTGLTMRAREGYVRVSATPWLDVEGGKRLVRWGVGYGFSPTGVLDPPRIATDPGDRLGLREGMPLVRADLFRGETSLTIAVAAPAWGRRHATLPPPSRLIALRVRRVWRGGLETALIGSASPNDRASFGGNVTHVLGQRLEWHAEALVHGNRRVLGERRTISGAAGLQYTLPGVNVVLEYHRVGTGHTSGGASSHQLFLRAARAGADVKITPELIVIRTLRSGQWTAVAGLGWNVHRRLDLYARATHVDGLRNPAGDATRTSSMLLAGASIRF